MGLEPYEEPNKRKLNTPLPKPIPKEDLDLKHPALREVEISENT